MSQVSEHIPFDCNKKEYVKSLIQKVKECRTTKDKHMPPRCADVLANYKQLCGSHPLLVEFEEELRQTANELGLNTCPHITRALGTSEKSIQTTPQRRDGFLGMVETAYGVTGEKAEVPQPPVAGMSGFERQLEAATFGGSQNTVRSAIASHEEKVVTRNRRMGFRDMLDEAFPEGEERMMRRDDPYLLAKPPTNGAFSWMKKKKDTSPIELLALLKARLRAVREKGQKILIVYYEELIRKLEATLGVTNLPTQRTAGFIGMLESAYRSPKEEKTGVNTIRVGEKIRAMRGFFDEYEIITAPKGT